MPIAPRSDVKSRSQSRVGRLDDDFAFCSVDQFADVIPAPVSLRTVSSSPMRSDHAPRQSDNLLFASYAAWLKAARQHQRPGHAYRPDVIAREPGMADVPWPRPSTRPRSWIYRFVPGHQLMPTPQVLAHPLLFKELPCLASSNAFSGTRTAGASFPLLLCGLHDRSSRPPADTVRPSSKHRLRLGQVPGLVLRQPRPTAVQTGLPQLSNIGDTR